MFLPVDSTAFHVLVGPPPFLRPKNDPNQHFCNKRLVKKNSPSVFEFEKLFWYINVEPTNSKS